MNCTYSNYTEAFAIYSTAQQYSKFILHLLYKLYNLQLNCTYSNYVYTKDAVTCSAARQHNIFFVQILNKLYSLKLKCTYVTTEKMMQYVQLYKSIAHLLYKY